jgi:hypothetical protein
MPPPSPHGWLHGVFRKNLYQGGKAREREQIHLINASQMLSLLDCEWYLSALETWE